MVDLVASAGRFAARGGKGAALGGATSRGVGDPGRGAAATLQVRLGLTHG